MNNLKVIKIIQMDLEIVLTNEQTLIFHKLKYNE